MKKVVLFGFVFVLFIFSTSGVLAVCNLEASLINQDPYPAVQGDYAKLVFQLKGVENAECGTVNFRLVEKYPISFDEGQQQSYTVQSGTFSRDYASFFLAPFKVRVSEDALNGDNPIEVVYSHKGNTGGEIAQFDLNIEDTRADFEVHVKDYDYIANTVTFEILNIADVDVKALTIELPDQEGVTVKGSNINIVGDLDSNEYTTADFEVILSDGEVMIKILYTDLNNVRRTVEKSVPFKMAHFQDRAGDGNGSSGTIWVIVIVVIVIVGFLYYRSRKKKKKMLARKHGNSHK